MKRYRRRPHVLRHNNETTMPENFIFFDTETRPVPRGKETELVFAVGTAILYRRIEDYRLEYVFHSPKRFWDIVDANSRSAASLYLIAHNVGFDFRVLKGFAALKARGFKTEKVIFNQSANVWSFKRGSAYIHVLDNMNFFKGSLESVGQSIGFPKTKMPDISENEALIEYCMNDTRIIFNAWLKLLEFLTVNDLGNFSKTVAGQAFNAFRHRFMKEKIYIHDREAATNLEREAYRGGRTECFRIGKMPRVEYRMLDVNSMYPSVMRDETYPVKLIGGISSLSDAVKCMDAGQGVIVKVLLDMKTNVFGIKKDGKLIFPVGVFEAVLTTRELKYALMCGSVREFREGYVYEMKNIFKEYVDFFYGKKRQYAEAGNTAFCYLCKIFLNSLYGKFGQRNEIYENVGYTDSSDGVEEFYDTDKSMMVKRRIINGSIQESIGYREGYESFCAIAAHVTADARMKLWNLFLVAGDANVFYCDTDSVIVNERGAKRLFPFIGKELGMLSEKEKSTTLAIYGNKDYVFGKTETMKGVKKNAVRVGKNEFEQDIFEGMAGAIRNGRLNRMMIHRMRKVLKRTYDKGDVLKDGRVEPFRLTFQESVL